MSERCSALTYRRICNARRRACTSARKHVQNGLLVEKEIVMTCGKSLASGQWWNFCGETDMGQTAPVQCVECSPKYGYLLAGATEAQVADQDAKRAAAGERYKAAGFVGSLETY